MNFKLATKLNITLLILAVITLSIAYIVIRYKLFAPVHVEEEMSLGSGNLLYIPYQGDYCKICTPLNAMMKELSAEFGKDIKYFGIYYDNPYDLENKNEARAILGGCFDQSIDLNAFLSKHPNYKTTSFTNMKGFGAKFPLYCSLNLYSAIMRGYPVIYKYGVDKNLLSDKLCSIEFYDYSNNQLTIAFPDTTGNESILTLSGYSTPKMKPSSLKKKE